MVTGGYFVDFDPVGKECAEGSNPTPSISTQKAPSVAGAFCVERRAGFELQFEPKRAKRTETGGDMKHRSQSHPLYFASSSRIELENLARDILCLCEERDELGSVLRGVETPQSMSVQRGGFGFPAYLGRHLRLEKTWQHAIAADVPFSQFAGVTFRQANQPGL